MNIFAQNIEISGMPPSNFSISGVRNATWGHWIVDTVGLDKSRWKVSSNGVEPIYKKASNPNNSLGCGIVILIIPTSANKPAHISFDPELFEKGPGAKHALCKGLRAAYPKGSKRIIPLEDTGRIKFYPPPLFFSSLLNLDVGATPQGTTPSTGGTFKDWGEWIVDTAGLDKTKWKVNQNGIEPIYQFDAKTPASSQGCGAVITITPAAQNNPPNITFDPDQINGNNANNSLCKKRGEI